MEEGLQSGKAEERWTQMRRVVSSDPGILRTRRVRFHFDEEAPWIERVEADWPGRSMTAESVQAGRSISKCLPGLLYLSHKVIVPAEIPAGQCDDPRTRNGKLEIRSNPAGAAADHAEAHAPDDMVVGGSLFSSHSHERRRASIRRGKAAVGPNLNLDIRPHCLSDGLHDSLQYLGTM